MKRYDGIAFAGALGALAGLSVAIVNAWEVLPTILSAVVCMGVAGVAYRPLEILMVVVNACRALPGAVRSTPQWFGVRKEQLQKGIRATLFVIGCIALALLSFLAIPMLLFLGGVLPNLTTHRGEHLGIGVDILVLGGALFAGGLLTTFYLLVVSIGDETPPWALRIGKAFERMIDLGRRINEMEQEGVAKKKWAILLLCLCVPVFAQILSIGIVVFLLDVLSTFLLALASTERIAAILGGVLGWGTAVLLHVLGAPGDLFLLVIGGAVGWYVGPFLHWLRAYLSLVPVVETVQSS